jgi:RNA-directed DNA polymerase
LYDNDKIYARETLWEARNRVRANKGAAGVDRQTLAKIEKLGQFLLDCQKQLEQGTYHPQPVIRQYIPKKVGRQRPLGIPTVRDRIIQMATKLMIEPIYEADFQESSFGFRPKRSAKQALDLIRKACNQTTFWAKDNKHGPVSQFMETDFVVFYSYLSILKDLCSFLPYSTVMKAL